MFVSDLHKVGGFLWVLRFPPAIKEREIREENTFLAYLAKVKEGFLHYLVSVIVNIFKF
jgi:hypothetical protein